METKVLNPSPQLLMKLGSAIVHFQEYISNEGHYVDKIALEGLLLDEEVNDWIKEMDSMSLIPKKR